MLYLIGSVAAIAGGALLFFWAIAKLEEAIALFFASLGG